MGTVERRVNVVHNVGRRIVGEKNEYCHMLVAEVAMGCCAAVYDALAKQSNVFYAENPSSEAYVAKSWGLYVQQARQNLAHLLGASTTLPQSKEIIYEALLLDQELHRGKTDCGIQVGLH